MSPNFYHAFISSHRKILKDVLLNELDERLFVEALATHESAKIISPAHGERKGPVKLMKVCRERDP